MEEIKHWTEIQTNPYVQKPNAVMALHPEGDIILCKTLLKGESRGNGNKLYKIRFDRDFVIKYILKKVLEPLRLNHRYDLALELFEEAYRAYRPDIELTPNKVSIPPNIKRYKLHGKEVVRVEDLENYES